MATQLLGVAVPESQQQYGSILTERGENAELNGKLQNKGIQFKYIDFGDANDTYVQPNRKQQALTHKLGRIPVNSVDVLQPTPDSIPMLKVEAILPSDMHDLVIREYAAVAEFDGREYLHAIGNCARVYVPNPALNGGTSNPVTLEMIFVITSAEPIIEIDPLVIQASREYVKVQDTENLGKVFGSKPVDLVNNIVITPTNNQYPKLSAFGAIYELADNSVSYTVKSFAQSVGGDCVITLSDDTPLIAKKVDSASQNWTTDNFLRLFNNVSEMKRFNCKLGGKYRTRGFYYFNDGGGALYEIKESGVDIGMRDHKLINGLYACLVIENLTVNVDQFGCAGNRAKNDSPNLQSSLDAMRYGYDWKLGDNKQYRLDEPVKITKTGYYRGGAMSHDINLYDHHAQLFVNYNGHGVELVPDLAAKPFSQDMIILEKLWFRRNDKIITAAGAIAAKHTLVKTIVRYCHFNALLYGICPLGSWGLTIDGNTFEDLSYGITANPDVIRPLGSARLNQYQTNALLVANNKIKCGPNGIGVDINCSGANIIIESTNVFEDNLDAVRVSSYTGDFDDPDSPDLYLGLHGVSVKDSYFERSVGKHIQVGREYTGSNSKCSTEKSAVNNMDCYGNQLNRDHLASHGIEIIADKGGRYDNSFRNDKSKQDYLLYGDFNFGTSVRIQASSTYSGAFKMGNECSVTFDNYKSIRTPPSILYVNPNHVDSVASSQKLSVYAGLETKPFQSIRDAFDYLNFFSDVLLKNGVSTVTINCSGDCGLLSGLPILPLKIYISSAESGSFVNVGNISGGEMTLVNMKLKNTDANNSNPLIVASARLFLKKCHFEYVTPANSGATSLITVSEMSSVSLHNCTTNKQLSIKSDASVVILSSPELTGTEVKLNGGQIFK